MANPIAKHYTRLLALWPKDALRPNLPFTRAIEHRGQPFGVKPSEPSPSSTPSASKPSSKTPSNSTITSTSTSSTPPQNSNSNAPHLEIPHINALFSLLENRYAKKYALSPEALKPKSAPEHYTRLMEEIERAPKRTWWQAKVEEWKMKVRWS
ncbi:hypothetical protein T440DRAFT_498641 [Plenodomus tracheiphilus IPT5]|uniref:Uncharacterized protein n=1 Tax=Plenodomus tracheiphilus IPT5 TaxID=1408161 RepID=A0A6A7B704_9PLEO|nr:hypothetical protein T440DRAFT_498641 [Plenodomus tracheiphilus IPT5]